jgi:hypothetical protein
MEQGIPPDVRPSGGVRIVKQEEFAILVFKGNSGVSRVELPVLILVAGYTRVAIGCQCYPRDLSGAISRSGSS